MTSALLFWGSGGQDLLPLGKVDALVMVDTIYQAESESANSAINLSRNTCKPKRLHIALLFLGSGGV